MLHVLFVDGQRVTIAASVARPKIGGNYIEFDVSPDDARRLALLLLTTADDAEAEPSWKDETARYLQRRN